jgi:hypothetical protein
MLLPGLKSGRWQAAVGAREFLSSRRDQFHWLYPTVFECYRKRYGIPQDKTWLILFGPHDITGSNFSLHPAYGPPYQASMTFAQRSDPEVLDSTLAVMDSCHPSLVEVGFGEVDYVAQETGSWRRYVRAIAVVDSLIWELWRHIQGDPFYRDRTTMVVLSEHGRHDWDFQWHDDDCNGCRRLPFLVVGPDTKSGVVITERGDIIDVAPTIAALLGCPMPMARGRILNEMLCGQERGRDWGYRPGKASTRESIEGVRLSYSPGISCSPSVASDSQGVYVAWAEGRSDPARGEGWDILGVRSSDGGTSWTPPETLFQSSPDTVYYYGTLAANSICGAVLAASGFRWIPAEGRYRWGLRIRVKPPGQPWMKPTPFFSGENGFAYAGMDSRPALDLRSGEISVFSLTVGNLYDQPTIEILLRSLDRGETWQTFELSRTLPGRSSWPRYPQGPNVGSDAQGLLLLESLRYPCPGPSESQSHVYLSSWPQGGPGWPCRIDSLEGESLEPTFRIVGDVLHLAWAHQLLSSWGVVYRRSTDRGRHWGGITALSSELEAAWMPHMACSGDTLVCAWEDFRDPKSGIFCRFSLDGGRVWGPELRLSEAERDCYQPWTVLAQGQACVVWQQDLDGNWEIYFRRTAVSVDARVH